jgi:ubiquinone/menaquinone biosynthesis C-methylase UbiE
MMTTVATQKRQAIDLHSAQADLFAARYDEADAAAYRDCFAYSRHRLQRLLDEYLPVNGGGARLLDVGCGTGHFLAELRRRGYDGAGVDGSAEMLAHARQVNPGAELRQADVEALPFPDASFDFLLCVEVLRYLPDPARCIAEFGRVLRPGGVCLATAAPAFNLNGYWLVNRLAPLVPFARLVRLRQFFSTSGGLRRHFAAAGFPAPVVHGVYFGPINWVERLAPRLLPRFLRGWERLDCALADRDGLREFANMFLVYAVRGR